MIVFNNDNENNDKVVSRDGKKGPRIGLIEWAKNDRKNIKPFLTRNSHKVSVRDFQYFDINR
jgi:hypothetical protein